MCFASGEDAYNALCELTRTSMMQQEMKDLDDVTLRYLRERVSSRRTRIHGDGYMQIDQGDRAVGTPSNRCSGIEEAMLPVLPQLGAPGEISDQVREKYSRNINKRILESSLGQNLSKLRKLKQMRFEYKQSLTAGDAGETESSDPFLTSNHIPTPAPADTKSSGTAISTKGSSSTTQPNPLSDKDVHILLQRVVAMELLQCGFTSFDRRAMDIFSEVVAKFVTNLGKKISFFQNQVATDKEGKWDKESFLEACLGTAGVSPEEIVLYAHDNVVAVGKRLDQVQSRLQSIFEGRKESKAVSPKQEDGTEVSSGEEDKNMEARCKHEHVDIVKSVVQFKQHQAAVADHQRQQVLREEEHKQQQLLMRQQSYSYPYDSKYDYSSQYQYPSSPSSSAYPAGQYHYDTSGSSSTAPVDNLQISVPSTSANSNAPSPYSYAAYSPHASPTNLHTSAYPYTTTYSSNASPIHSPLPSPNLSNVGNTSYSSSTPYYGYSQTTTPQYSPSYATPSYNYSTTSPYYPSTTTTDVKTDSSSYPPSPAYSNTISASPTAYNSTNSNDTTSSSYSFASQVTTPIRPSVS